ncbi:MAG: hypothetical protein ABC537_04975 [Candidatus Methanosuratincola sp.]
MEKGAFHRREVQRLLRAIKEGRISFFKPLVSFSEGVHYPEVQEITGADPHESAELLFSLEREGILTSEEAENLIVCPVCGSHQFFIQIRCRTCGSMKISRAPMLEHLKCGMIDSEDAFRQGDHLVCPKCHKPLTAIGVDYRRHGYFYRCSSCGRFDPTPEKHYICQNGHRSGDSELQLERVPGYRLSPGGLAILERRLIDLSGLTHSLRSLGFYVEEPARIRGKSGVEHDFDLVVWENKDSAAPLAAVSIYSSDRPIDSFTVLATMAKSIDVGFGTIFIAVIPTLDEPARSLAEGYNIQVIEASSASDLIERLKSRIEEAIKKPTVVRSVPPETY